MFLRFCLLTLVSSFLHITGRMFCVEWFGWISFWSCLTPALLQTAWNSICLHEQVKTDLNNIFNRTQFAINTMSVALSVWNLHILMWSLLSSWLGHLLSSQHATCSTSTQWRWSPWQALRLLPRPYLRHWLPLLHLLPPLCTSRCLHKASRWPTTRGSKSGSHPPDV